MPADTTPDIEITDDYFNMGSCEKRTCVDVTITEDMKLEKTESFTLTLVKDQVDPHLGSKINLTDNVLTISIADNEGGRLLPFTIQTHATL